MNLIARTKLQAQAAKENFCLYLLRGMKANLAFISENKVVDRHLIAGLAAYIDAAIRDIKSKQQERNPKRKIKP